MTPQQKWYRKNREKVLEYGRQWYKKNKKRLTPIRDEYRKKNKKRLAEWNAEYYERNKDAYKRRDNDWRKKNPDKAKAIRHRYDKKNPGANSSNAARWRALVTQATVGDIDQIRAIYRKAKTVDRIRCYICNRFIPTQKYCVIANIRSLQI